jgi:hypothetical protein
MGWLLIGCGSLMMLLFIGVMVVGLTQPTDDFWAGVVGSIVFFGMPAAGLMWLGQRLRRRRARRMATPAAEFVASTIESPAVEGVSFRAISEKTPPPAATPAGDPLLLVDKFLCAASASSLMANTATVTFHDPNGLQLGEAALAFGITSEQAQRQMQHGIQLVSSSGEPVVKMKGRKAVVWNTFVWDIFDAHDKALAACSHKSLQLALRDRWPFSDSAGQLLMEVSETLQLTTLLRLIPIVGQFVSGPNYVARCGHSAVATITNLGIGFQVDLVERATVHRRLLLAFCVLRFATRS